MAERKLLQILVNHVSSKSSLTPPGKWSLALVQVEYDTQLATIQFLVMPTAQGETLESSSDTTKQEWEHLKKHYKG
jgi:hypothetical protein